MKTIFFTIALFVQSTIFFAQEVRMTQKESQVQDKGTLYFPINSDLLQRHYRNNAALLDKLDSILTNKLILKNLDSIIVTSSASPDGNQIKNVHLAMRRGKALIRHIEMGYRHIPPSKVKNPLFTPGWEYIGQVIAEDSAFPYRSQALLAINGGTSQASIEAALRRIEGGKAWRYIVNNYLSRYTSVATVLYYIKNIAVPMKIQDDLVEVLKKIELANPPVAEKDSVLGYVKTPVKPIKKPLFAAKTNLLFDVASLTNIELEVPIGQRWSIAAEWIFPWWKMDNSREQSKRNRAQLLNGNLEGRYWFGDRSERPHMTGWFAGVGVGGGLYDFEYDTRGYQGEFLMTGISGGYIHTIGKSKNLRMEYSLGLGCIGTDYNKYESTFGEDQKWHAIRQGSGRTIWFGPTKAKVSLVWMLNRKVKRGEKQ
ncbi:MAG: DUF3575 domain-containing protein [Bacteroidales bacterium]